MAAWVADVYVGGRGGRSLWVGRVENLDKARQEVVVLGSADQPSGIERGDDDEDGVDEKLD